MKCRTPPLDRAAPGYGLEWSSLSSQHRRHPHPVSGSTRLLFPGSHWYPHYAQRLVKFEISNNGQDFSDSGLTYLYQAPAIVESVSPKHYGVSVGNDEIDPGCLLVGDELC